MTPAEFEGFYFLCPDAPSDGGGWHILAYGYPEHCRSCGRPLRSFGGRYIYDVPFLMIHEEEM